MSMNDDLLERLRRDVKEAADEIARLRAALAQGGERQEPVAWLYTSPQQEPYLSIVPCDVVPGETETPLYAAPPAAAPLLRVNHIEVIYDHVKLVLKGVSLDLAEPPSEWRDMLDRALARETEGDSHES